ncbi:hypothetical protein [Microbulbifer sp. GL-2]|uniref:hypothetical protein n=1 Tax=Microbulbifer sp. GL-2 TaxID=2591606 RepID=UPI001164B5E5|nr:hypothetical protein [Microbulbifer sp. GL-2]BBM01827.1 hypothetical protein GL2_19010 [Microbulbifer sp. GL-2]
MPSLGLREKLDATFDKYVQAELAGNLDETLATIAPNPDVLNIPTLLGGQGPQGVQTFYSKRLIGQFFSA